mgnify:CR=1 FL=1
MKKTPALMFQGTCSNAGKSILTAAFCRILLQDGYNVAPFKAQNMSLNSFVTRDGREMGRAQVVQAQACRKDPDVRMNPVLMKPCSDVGCQIIVAGLPVDNMSVEEYIEYKPQALSAACAAYDSLAAEHDVIVLEGAGSPAEINLKRHDIVNMTMARHADARVLLAGDIDRGGVFASFVGTLALLDDWEKELVAGFVVNKFRGRRELLDEALTYTLEKTGKPVVGVVDYLSSLGLPEEDSVGFKAGLFNADMPAAEHVTIGLIDLPHISNFTDFEPFLDEPDVHLKIVRQAGDLDGSIDAILLPGSKNVMADTAWLHKTGMAGVIDRAARQSEIIGICGGFQMLGNKIEDPHRIESAGRPCRGLGLLDITTILAETKTLTRTSGMHLESNATLSGYEIHHGRTVCGNVKPVHRLEDGEGGAQTDNGLVWGSYLHGLFDEDGFRRWFVDRLRVRKGLDPVGRIVSHYNLEPAFDRLADAVRSRIDLPYIYTTLGL